MAEQHPLAKRNIRHVANLLGHIFDTPNGTTEDELADLTTTWPWSTTSRILRELAAYGAIHVTVDHRHRTRTWHPTPLGEAWLERDIAAWPWPQDDDNADE